MYTNFFSFLLFKTTPVGGLFGNKDFGPYISPLPYQYWGGYLTNL